MDMQESYPALFELLWYSQLPCYDILNVTTTEGQDNGEDCFQMHNCCPNPPQQLSLNVFANANRNDQGLHMERPKAELLCNLLQTANRQGHVLFV